MRHTVICIGRESGSGGKVIGQEVAKRLGIEFYDSNLLEMAKEYGGITSDSLDKSDEKATNQFYYKLLYEGNENVVQERPATEMLYQLQSDVIKKIARTHDCVIVGRCADYVLKDEAVNKISIFITAPAEARADRIMKTENLSNMQAKSFIKKTDTRRKNYYNYFSKQKWGGKDNYDMTINSHSLGIEGTTDLICQIYKNYLKKE